MSFASCIWFSASTFLIMTLCSCALPFIFSWRITTLQTSLRFCQIGFLLLFISLLFIAAVCTFALLGFKKLPVLLNSFALKLISSGISPAGSQGSLKSAFLNSLVFVLLFPSPPFLGAMCSVLSWSLPPVFLHLRVPHQLSTSISWSLD